MSDLISRQWLMECVNEGWIKFDTEKDTNRFIHLVRDMAPPVMAEPKTGHWIEKDGFDGDVYYDCSECGESWETIEGTPWQNGMGYCPNCGCRMFEPQESEG